MTRLADWFVKAGTLCGLSAEADYVVQLNNGRKLNSVVRVSGVGAKNGMLIFTDHEAIRDHKAELISLGYGCSTMSEPRCDEKFDLESFEEVFTDWGWCASPGPGQGGSF
jgi:hypothetical protein